MLKRIVYISCIVLVIGGIFNIIKKQEYIETFGTSVTNRVVVVDAGHGGMDKGAQGLYGSSEDVINLKIALKLQQLLEQSGAVVLLTRSDENSMSDADAKTIREKKVSDIRNRVMLGNNEDVDIVVSIHMNKFEDSKYYGWQSFYQKRSEDSRRLSNHIQMSMNSVINVDNHRQIKPLSGIYMMDHIDNPTVTIECGFLSNSDEVKRLQDDKYLDKIALGIFIGIEEYFKE